MRPRTADDRVNGALRSASRPSRHPGRCWRLPPLIVLALALSYQVADAAYLDPPGPGHTIGAAVRLIDLTPPGALLTPGILSPRAGRVTLLPGAGGGVLFLPGFSSGPRLCFGGHNPAVAGVICAFTDNVPAPGIGWHAEFVVHNPNPLAGVGFNAAFFDGWGNVYAGPAFLGPLSTLYVDMHMADASLPHFSELGVTHAWAASTVPVQLDTSFTVEEGVLLGDGLFPCPLRVAAIQGPTPQGSFGCTYRFFSDPSDSWVDAPDDPSLARFSIMDPADVAANPEIFPDLTPVPGPATLLLCGIGVVGLLGYRGWRRRSARP